MTYAGYKKTKLTTYEYGKRRRVFKDKEGKLYYRVCNNWHGTCRELCQEQ